MSQSEDIAFAIERYMENGMTNKQEIFTKVVEVLGVPRPTVRRVARDLRIKLATYARILKA